MDLHNQQPIIELVDVTCSFAPDAGVFDIDLQVQPGTIFGLIGPSGSGKTTTVRTMVGLYRPDKGQVKVLGETPTSFSKRTRECIGYMPQQFVLYPNLTVYENLRFVSSLYGMGYYSRTRRLSDVLDFVELTEARNRLGSKLSGGMKRRLELACSLVHNPRLLFADEPTAGVDPVLRNKFWSYFRQLRDEGHTLFVTTQYIGEAVYCDLVGVMREGRMLVIDTPEGLRRRALGGEVLRILLKPHQTFRAAEMLQHHPDVSSVRIDKNEPGLLFVTVNDAAIKLPDVIEALGDDGDIEVLQAEEYLPPFDDVFVMLMEQAEPSHA